jgi:DNA-binding response OmpR family regulator
MTVRPSEMMSWPPPLPVVVEHQTVQACGIEIDRTAFRVTVHGRVLKLPLREFQLLELLVANPDVVFTREQLAEWLWGGSGTNTLTVHIGRLRNKIEKDPHHPECIQTVRGVGYRFDSRCPPAA